MTATTRRRSRTCTDRRPGRRGPRGHPDRPRVDVVDDIDLVLRPGEVVGLVGESGSGKTTVGTSLLGYSRAGALISAGKVLLEGRDVLKMPWKEVRQLRGEEIAYVPQDPASALNPTIRIGKQIVELLAAARHRHRRVAPAGRARRPGRGGAAQRRRVPEALRPPALGRPGAARRAGDGVPAQAQGAGARRADHRPRRDHPEDGARDDGRAVPDPRRQRALRHPRPRGGGQHRRPGRGDVRRRRSSSWARRTTIFASPSHPYTRALLDSIPHLSQARALTGIPGRTPAPGARPDGCRFHDRCAFVVDACRQESCPSYAASPRTTTCAASASRRSGPGTSTAAPSRTPTPTAARRDPLGRRAQRLLRPHAGRPRRELRPGQGRGGGAGRRVRQRQDHHLALGRWAAQGLDRHDLLRGPRAGQERPRAQRRRPQADAVHLPEPLPVAEPAADRRADHQAADGAVRARQGQGRDRPRGRADGAGRPRPADAALPGQPALRRRAAAGRDRPGAGRRAGRADLRRDHLGARRVGAGLDRRAARGTSGSSAASACSS